MPGESGLPIFHAGKNTKSLASLSEAQRGVIGEILTELTLLAYGYVQLDSKYEGNHGLDGIFVRANPQITCFITESKCREESCKAKAIFEKCLSGATIRKTVTKGKGKEMESSAEAYATLEKLLKGDNRTYRFAHRILASGLTQGYSRILEIETEFVGLPSTDDLKENMKGLSPQRTDNTVEHLEELLAVAKAQQQKNKKQPALRKKIQITKRNH
jgi:hypothetical protein